LFGEVLENGSNLHNQCATRESELSPKTADLAGLSVTEMNIDYSNLATDVESGRFRERLRTELVIGFRAMREAGERLPLATYYATQIAAIVDQGSPEAIEKSLAYEIYQEILEACESAREGVAGKETLRS
jgi:hypothetical protein